LNEFQSRIIFPNVSICHTFIAMQGQPPQPQQQVLQGQVVTGAAGQPVSLINFFFY